MSTELNKTSLMRSIGSFAPNMSPARRRQLVATCIEHSREFFLWRNVRGQIEFISTSCLQLTGYSADEFIRDNTLLLKIIHPDDHPSWIAKHTHAHHKKIQLRIIHKSGDILWFEHNCTHVCNSEGETETFAGNFIDITEIKKKELNSQKLATAVEQNHYGVVIADRFGVIEYLNPAFSTMQSGTILLTAGDTLPLLDAEHNKITEITSTLEEGKMWYEDSQEGTNKWYTTRISPIFEESGNLSHFLIAKVDITERIQDKERVIEQHKQLQSLFKLVEAGKREWEWSLDCIEDAVILTDRDHCVQRTNHTIKKMLNIEVMDYIGQDWRSILPKKLKNREDLPEEGEFYVPQQKKWLQYQRFTFTDSQADTKIKQVITLHDITRVKVMNQDLSRAYEHLKSTQSQMVHQEKMASIGQLAAGVAHEINNPTGFITSNLASLQRYTTRLIDYIKFLEQTIEPLSGPETAQQLSAEQKKIKLAFIQEDIDDLVAESLEGAERIKVIVQNLKSFSRVDDAATTINDLHECLDSALSIGWNEIKYKASIEKDYQPIPEIYCSAQQLNQVFLNLMVNAAQAIDEQGVISISTVEQDGWVIIKISDTGGGIPEKNLSQIFDPFYTTKEVGQGTGLGLSICYDIIKNHNGTIHVASHVGEGTTFTIKLPIITQKPETVEKPKGAQGSKI